MLISFCFCKIIIFFAKLQIKNRCIRNFPTHRFHLCFTTHFFNIKKLVKLYTLSSLFRNNTSCAYKSGCIISIICIYPHSLRRAGMNKFKGSLLIIRTDNYPYVAYPPSSISTLEKDKVAGMQIIFFNLLSIRILGT